MTQISTNNRIISNFLRDLANRYEAANTTPSGTYRFLVPGLRLDAKIKIRQTGLVGKA